MIGIYKIQNKINNKLYIGSSKDIKKRFLAHTSLLKSKKHHSIHLQNAFNKHGIENFTFEILEECLLENLLQTEQFYMNSLLKANEYVTGISAYFIDNGYNICPYSIKGFTGKQSKYSILKQLKSRGVYDEIYRIDKNGNVLNIYDMYSECLDIRQTVIHSCKNKTLITNKNYGYVKSKDYDSNYVLSEKKDVWNKGLSCPTNKGVVVYVYDIYNRFYKKFDTIANCAKHFCTDITSIHRKMNMKNKKCKLIGNSKILFYRFYKEPLFEKSDIINVSNIGNIEVYTVFNEFLGYSSVEELILILNVLKSSVKYVLNKKRNQIRGYNLKYRNDIV